MTSPDIQITLPDLPAKQSEFIEYVATHNDKPMYDLLQPYKDYDNELRKAFAQQPDHPAVQDNTGNLTPMFNSQHESEVKIRARDPEAESQSHRDTYIMPLRPEERKANGSPAIVQSLQEFKTNFAIFSETSLADLDWNNVVVAGSSVVTSLLSVPKKHAGSKKSLRNYYHEILAPASDVDLFLYGLTEEQAIEKIRQIETAVKDALLVETTTIRTKNAITIASQYPTRHVQIVLRIYKSISEILTGFDVDCSCAAFDGKQVWASPRAVAAYMTQVNTVDLTRRSPSYENRLSKYRHRGFEVQWPMLDRSRIDPTIFERSFSRTEGLARLLIVEKLPKSSERDAYIDQRRVERGRPPANRSRMQQRFIRGNIKNRFEDEVAEWVDEEEVSNYHTFTVPYGPHFHAKKIEKLLYTKDLLLNSEWNKPKDREVNLHRHPAFFGTVEDVIHDCCGYCPKSTTEEEEEVAEEESKTFVQGEIGFIKDDPGRQAIGSFNPISADDYTAMAYVGNTQMLCQAIVDCDVEYVRQWLAQEGNDPDTRDYTGRTPLHLAVAQSTPEMVQCLIDGGARMVARLVDGKTALHLAAIRGNVEMVSALLRRSAANEEEEEKKVDARRAARKAAKQGTPGDAPMADADPAKDSDDDIDMVDDADEDTNMDATTEASMVNIKTPTEATDALDQEDEDEPDVYDVNVLGWDTAVSPLHLAIVNGHIDVVKCLVQEFGADVLLPVKLFNDFDRSARAAILTLILALHLPFEKAKEMTTALLALGATCAQADMDQTTALHYCVDFRSEMLDTYIAADKTGVDRALNHLALQGSPYRASVISPLLTAILGGNSTVANQLLQIGAKPSFSFDAYMKAVQSKWSNARYDSTHNKRQFETVNEQPVVVAVQCEMALLAAQLIESHGVDPNVLTTKGYDVLHNEYTRRYNRGQTILDLVRAKIETLRTWKPSESKHEPPEALKDDKEYLKGDADSYQRWSSSKQLRQAKEQYQREWKAHVEAVRQSRQEKPGSEQKQAAIYDMLASFRKLEAVLVAKSAKTFKELHPEVEDPEQRDSYGYRWDPPKPQPFKTGFTFNLPDVSDEAQERYVKLFDAAWKGEVKTLKELTLLPWKNAQDETQPPLKIAVQDQHQLSPFSIALLHGNFELGKTIMEIAQAQYVPPDAPAQRHYRVDGGGDDDDDDEDEDDDDDGDGDVRLTSDVVDDMFTVDNVGEVSTQVKSRTKAVNMLIWSCRAVSDFIKTDQNSRAPASPFLSNKRTNTGSIKALKQMMEGDNERRNIPTTSGKDMPQDLIQLAIFNNDQDLLSYLLGLGEDFTSKSIADSEEASQSAKPFSVSHDTFLFALKANRPHLLAELIKRTGAGIPLDKFAKKSGVEVTEKPKYYQGLSVYGRKRKDWADAGMNTAGPYEPYEHKRPPLLEAAHYGVLDTVEWLMSEAPLRCYRQFAQDHASDKRLQLLAKSKKGFEGSVTKFLGTHAQFALHSAVIAEPTIESLELVQYLAEAMPEAMEAKNVDGMTPLAVAFGLYRHDAAKILIEAGADQTLRAKNGRNLAHLILENGYITKEPQLKQLLAMLDLIDERLLPGMFLERCSLHPGSLTPLALWLQTLTYQPDDLDKRLLRILLSRSQGRELGLLNGEGDTPLHVMVRKSKAEVAEVFLEGAPELVNRENAVGQTPYEMAENKEIASMCSDPPSMVNRYPAYRPNGRHKGSHYSSITDVDAKEFVKAAEEGEEGKTGNDETNGQKTCWQLVKEARAKLESEGRSKRRLVTLNEANVVAERVAQAKSQRGRYGRAVASEDDEDEEGEVVVADEVSTWVAAANRWDGVMFGDE